MQPSLASEKLAIHGGRPIRNTPFSPWPEFGADEIEAAVRVLRSGRVNYWTGDEGLSFETEFAAYHGRRFGIALANGSVALELAALVLGIGEGDEVIVPSRTFIATATSTATLRGAKPIFADVDRESQNVTAETVRPCITSRTKAIVAVHLGGWPCDMDPLMALAREHKISVIEDCAQAHGARYRGKVVGSFGDVAAFSFCRDKIMTTAGEGGMLLLDDEARWSRAWSFKDHGKSFDAVYRKEHPPGFRWVHESCGTNWRLTEPQSAIGRVQLKNLERSVAKRRQLAETLQRGLSQVSGLRVPVAPAGIEHSYYKFSVFLDLKSLADGWTRDRVQEAILAEGVPCFYGSCSEIYLEKAFDPEIRPVERLPVARELGETSLMFQVHPTLSETDMGDVCSAVSKVLEFATRSAYSQR